MLPPLKQPIPARAFTLIEILVVIVIIAIIAAMLLPALGGARAKGQQAVCANNLRQIFLGIQSYANEHDGYLPGPIFSAQLTGYVKQDAFTQYRGNLAEYLYPYLGGKEPDAPSVYLRLPVFACPAWAAAIGSASQNLNNPKPKTAYVADTTYFGYINSTPPQKLLAVTNPVSSLVLTDLDAKNYSDPTMPSKPVHSGRRNCLFFDGHIEAR